MGLVHSLPRPNGGWVIVPSSPNRAVRLGRIFFTYFVEKIVSKPRDRHLSV
jgi:hypothetical protein